MIFFNCWIEQICLGHINKIIILKTLIFIIINKFLNNRPTSDMKDKHVLLKKYHNSSF